MFLVDLVQEFNCFFTEPKINFYLYYLEFALLFEHNTFKMIYYIVHNSYLGFN